MNSKWVNGLDSLYPARTKFYRQQAYLFCMSFTNECVMNGLHVHRPLSRLLSASDPSERSKAFKELVAVKAGEGFGLNESTDKDGFLDSLEAGRTFGELTLDAWLARAFASEYIAQAQKLAGGSWAETAQMRITRLLPIYVWLCRDAIARGQQAEAAKILSQAEQHVAMRLTREWRSGGAKAAETLVQLRPHLREMADLRSTLYQTTTPQDRQHAAESAFASMQYPQIADVALEILSTQQRRGSVDPNLGRTLAAREELTGELGRIDALAKAKLAYQGPGEVAAAKAAINGKIKAADARIKAALPVATNSTTLEPLKLSAMMSLLRDSEVLISSAVGSEHISFVMLDRQRAQFWQVPFGRQELEKRIAQLRHGVEENDKGTLEKFPLDAAHRLFVDLFGPVQQQLLAADHALFAVDGPLLGMPLHMLLTEPAHVNPASQGDYRNAKLKWFVYGPAISVVPSLRSVEALRKAPASKAVLAFAGVGNPILTGAKGALRKATVTRLLGGRGQVDPQQVRLLEPLPETADELSRVANSIGGRKEDLFVRERANEATVKQLDLSRYRIISFATHGLMAGDLSGLVEPALVLTPPDNATPLNDGLLTASEIASLKLDSDLVILSACNTAAANGTPQGEGLSGLARAFFAAGSRGVIVSHWAVPSKSTAILMARTAAIKGSGSQMNWAKALRAAMIELIEKTGGTEFAHPIYWAPFVAVGAG